MIDYLQFAFSSDLYIFIITAAGLTFNTINNQTAIFKQELQAVQMAALDDENSRKEEQLVESLNELLKKEKIFWLQRSRFSWIKEGDRNTIFSHISTLNRRRKNIISSIRMPFWDFSNDEKDIIRIFTEYFNAIFSFNNPIPIDQEFHFTDSLVSREENEFLESIPSVEEIKEALDSMGPLKEPNSDGISAIFYQKLSDITRNDLVRLVQHAFRECCIPEEINKTYIVLISKKEVVETPTDYKPISLCNVLYKLIAKIIVRCIKPFLDRLYHLLKVHLYKDSKYQIVS